MMPVCKRLSGLGAMWQPRTEKKQLDPAQNRRQNPELDHISFGDFQHMKEDLCHSHQDQDLAKAQILPEESPAPPYETSSTGCRLIVKIGIL
ncbi:MAG: hypothetical protein RIQ81_1516 [Pseudomonadota bacterium]